MGEMRAHLTHTRNNRGVQIFLCLIPGNDLWFLRHVGQNLKERHRGNNIYLDFITSLHTLAHICTERFNLNQTLTPSTPSDLLPKPASIPHSAYHPIMSTTSSCQAVFKHKDRDSITAEWLWRVILCPLAPLLPPADTHLLHAVTVAGKWVRRSNQSVFCHQDGLPPACTANNSQLLRSGHNTQSHTQDGVGKIEQLYFHLNVLKRNGNTLQEKPVLWHRGLVINTAG